MTRQPYPSDLTDAQWKRIEPHVPKPKPGGRPASVDRREIVNASFYVVREGITWRALPHDFPPWRTVYQQTQRWIRAEVFEAIVADLRVLIRLGEGKNEQPTAAIFDSRTLQGSVENGNRGGYDGHKKRKGPKLHLAVDTLGEFLALVVTPANVQDRTQVEELAARVQEATGGTIEVGFVDQGYTGEDAIQAAAGWGIRLEVVKLPEARQGFVLLPRRWVVERSFAWLTRFRRLVKEYERLPETLAGLHLVAFTTVMLGRMVKLLLAGSA
jgi:transposase